MRTSDPTAFWRAALWIAVIVGASLGFSRAFACATPFVALATIAAIEMERRQGLLAIALAWAVNQAIGFLVLSYPHDAQTFVWGGAIGLAMLAAYGLAATLARTTRHPVACPALALAAAFIAYESMLLATALVLQSGLGAFTPAIVARIFAINAVALAGLLVLHRIATGIGWIAPAPAHEPVRA